MGLNDRSSFSTWLEADYWLFGLIYHIVFKGSVLKEDLSMEIKKDMSISLKNEIDEKIIDKKKDSSNYMKNINRLGNLRERLKDSCEIYGKYVQ